MLCGACWCVGVCCVPHACAAYACAFAWASRPFVHLLSDYSLYAVGCFFFGAHAHTVSCALRLGRVSVAHQLGCAICVLFVLLARYGWWSRLQLVCRQRGSFASLWWAAEQGGRRGRVGLKLNTRGSWVVLPLCAQSVSRLAPIYVQPVSGCSALCAEKQPNALCAEKQAGCKRNTISMMNTPAACLYNLLARTNTRCTPTRLTHSITASVSHHSFSPRAACKHPHPQSAAQPCYAATYGTRNRSG